MSSFGKTSKTREVPSPVQPGDIVAEKYRVERTLAAGGMGVVALARHTALDQPVALKFLIPMVQDEHTTARFLREARASAKIQSEHVVKVFDCGVLPSGVPYMAMEYLQGTDLARHLREKGPLAAEDAADVLLEAIVGVAAAHACGIVHRDLKPSNLFLATQGANARVVKVLDFGISKMQPGPDDPIEDDLTGTAMMLGSPRYISPEQAQSSRDVDVRADIWSLGVILYELLDGKCPFNGDSMGEVLGKILLYRPPPLSESHPEVPSGLSAVVERCLMRDKELRFENVAAMAAALAPFASPRGLVHAERAAAVLGTTLHAASPRPSPASPDAEPTTVAEVPDRTAGSWTQTHGAERPRGRRLLTAVGGVLAVAGAVLLAYFLARREPSDSPSDQLAAAARPPAPAASFLPPTASASAAHTADRAPSPSASAAAASTAAQQTVPSASVRPQPSRPTGRSPGGGVLDRSD